MKPSLPRRDFIKKTAATGAGLMVLPTGTLFGQSRPNSKLNIALIGASGRAKAHWPVLKNEAVVAICDVDTRKLDEAAAQFPDATKYKDWRKCLEQKNLDAVVCCTPDHHHAHISIWAMNRGLHVYGEKPLANSVHEARMVRETYLKNRHKLATQCGTQRHANPTFNRVEELIRDGAIGELQEAHAFGNRKHDKTGYYPTAGSPPDFLDWDLWVGPSPLHPYHPGYFDNHQAPDGVGCLYWNMYRDWGNWQIGDMGSHTMDLAWNAIDATLPRYAEGEGDPFNPEVAPSLMKNTWINPANDWRGEIRVTWSQGGVFPQSPRRYVSTESVGHGVLFKGSEGFILTSFNDHIIMPFGQNANMTYYEPRKKSELLPEVGQFQEEWINACKGDLKTSCNFDYSGYMIEQLLVGLVAYDVGKKLDYDAKNMRFTNSPEANRRIKKEYRKGYPLMG